MSIGRKNQVRITGRKETVKMRKAVNDIDRCVACGVCAGECPREAISIYKGCYAVIDTARCVGCGICQGACPAGSIAVKEVSDGVK